MRHSSAAIPKQNTTTLSFIDHATFACLPPNVAPHPKIDLVEAAAVSTVGPLVQGPALLGAIGATAAVKLPWPTEGQSGLS